MFTQISQSLESTLRNAGHAQSKLQKHLRKEQLEQSQNSPGSNEAKSYQPTADVKGRIDPSEPDVIQQFRIKMRSGKQQYATEKAYEANNKT